MPAFVWLAGVTFFGAILGQRLSHSTSTLPTNTATPDDDSQREKYTLHAEQGDFLKPPS